MDWTAVERRLEEIVAARLPELNPLRQIMPVLVDPGAVVGDRMPPSGQAAWVTRPSWQFQAPADYPTAFWLPSDGSLPTPPAPPARARATITPYEVVVVVEFTGEDFADLRLLTGPAASPKSPITDRAPVLAAEWISYSLGLAEQKAIIAGQGTNADPVAGLATVPDFVSRAVGGDTLLDALVKAKADLVRNGRRPTAYLVGPSTEQALRTLKDASNRPIFQPDAPLKIADLPVVTTYGIPAGTSTYAFCGDWSATPIVIRPIEADGDLKPLEVRVTHDFEFAQDKLMVRVRERLTVAPLPGIGRSAVCKITGINAA